MREEQRTIKKEQRGKPRTDRRWGNTVYSVGLYVYRLGRCVSPILTAKHRIRGNQEVVLWPRTTFGVMRHRVGHDDLRQCVRTALGIRVAMFQLSKFGHFDGGTRHCRAGREDFLHSMRWSISWY